jgi:uncharacterized protein (TIGR02594 family)
MSGPSWLAKAHEEMGVEEVSGSESNPRIMEYFAAAPGSEWVEHDSVPWCGAMMAWLLKDYGLPDEPLRARAWLEWGDPIKEPVPGCVVVLRRGKDPKAGHVALFQQWSKDCQSLYLLGGNQGDRVSIARFKVDDVLGYRWPRGEKVPTGADLANGSRIKREAKELQKVGGATVAAGGATQLPAPPTETLSQFTAWQAWGEQLISFLTFLKTNWMLAAGLLMALAGFRIYRWRVEDAKEGRTWQF